MSKINEETADAQDVQYFFFGASYNPGLIDTFKRVAVTSVISHRLTLVPGGHMA